MNQAAVAETWATPMPPVVSIVETAWGERIFGERGHRWTERTREGRGY